MRTSCPGLDDGKEVLLGLKEVFHRGGDFLHVVHLKLTHVGNAESLILQSAITVAQLQVAGGKEIISSLPLGRESMTVSVLERYLRLG